MKHACVVLVALLAGCSEKVNVHVDCITTAAPAVECTLTQNQGKSEVEVCWDFSVTCANGAVVKAPNTCHKIKDGATEKVTIPGDKLTDIDKCGGDKPPQPRLENLTLNGKKSE